jgi:hypothetical protein
MTPSFVKNLIFFVLDISGTMSIKTNNGLSQYDVIRVIFLIVTEKTFRMNKTMKAGLIFFDHQLYVQSELVPVAHSFQKKF